MDEAIEVRSAEQHVLVEAILAGKDAIGVLPTGGDTPLCWELPALLLPAPTVVITPLLARVQDRLAHLDRSRFVSSRRSPLLYVTPERLQTDDCIALLRRNGVSRLVVDDAHCVSDRGHDFRPAYLGIAEVARRLGRPPILAITATATADTARDVAKRLGMHDPVLVRPGLVRPNLALHVLRTANEDRKREAMCDVLAREKGVGIVYVGTTELAHEVGAWLTREGAAHRVTVATKAFAPPRDKCDVRFVVHWTVPASLESYTEEAGHAGRDGARANAYLFHRREDARILTPRRRADRARLGAMVRYGQSVAECRAAQLLGYFGDPPRACGICDVCARGPRG